MAAATNGWDWLHKALTAYADDFCTHSIFRSVADFHLTIAKVGTFLDLLIDAGLSINRDKIIAILKLHDHSEPNYLILSVMSNEPRMAPSFAFPVGMAIHS